MTTTTTTTERVVDLLDLAAAAVSSSIVAAQHITRLARGELIIRSKADGTLVTNADLMAQQIIMQSLRRVSDDVRVVGEEAEEEMEQHKVTGHEEDSLRIFEFAKQELHMRYHYHNHIPQNKDTTHLPLAPTGSTTTVPDCEAVVRSPPLVEHIVTTDRVSVFIDPLDGTKAYARGDYQPVSILIAIILDQVPCFGVINKPFGYPGQTTVLDTGCVTIYGGTLLGAAYTAGGGFCTKAATGTSQQLPRAVISSSRSGGIVEEFVTHLGTKGMIHPTPLMISGAGEKSLRILLRSEQEGLWFFPKNGTSLWDVAASDALLRATGGRLTDKHGRDMDYSKTRLEAENQDGVVACYDRSLHAECIKLFLEGTWTND